MSFDFADLMDLLAWALAYVPGIAMVLLGLVYTGGVKRAKSADLVRTQTADALREAGFEVVSSLAIAGVGRKAVLLHHLVRIEGRIALVTDHWVNGQVLLAPPFEPMSDTQECWQEQRDGIGSVDVENPFVRHQDGLRAIAALISWEPPGAILVDGKGMPSLDQSFAAPVPAMVMSRQAVDIGEFKLHLLRQMVDEAAQQAAWLHILAARQPMLRVTKAVRFSGTSPYEQSHLSRRSKWLVLGVGYMIVGAWVRSGDAPRAISHLFGL